VSMITLMEPPMIALMEPFKMAKKRYPDRL
jgi:hypothetical protein